MCCSGWWRFMHRQHTSKSARETVQPCLFLFPPPPQFKLPGAGSVQSGAEGMSCYTCERSLPDSLILYLTEWVEMTTYGPDRGCELSAGHLCGLLINPTVLKSHFVEPVCIYAFVALGGVLFGFNCLVKEKCQLKHFFPASQHILCLCGRFGGTNECFLKSFLKSVQSRVTHSVGYSKNNWWTPENGVSFFAYWMHVVVAWSLWAVCCATWHHPPVDAHHLTPHSTTRLRTGASVRPFCCCCLRLLSSRR